MSTTIPIFIFAGQSNIIGRTEVDMYDLPENIRFYGLNGWGDLPNFWGPDIALFDALSRNYTELVALKVALGGTTIRNDPDPARPDWHPDSVDEMYDELLNRLSDVISDLEAQGYTPEVRAIFWHQGEAETNAQEYADAYAENMEYLVSSLRTDLGLPDLPFIMGQIGEDRPQREFNDDVLLAQTELPGEIDDLYLVSSTGLKLRDTAHFTAGSQYRMGRAMFDYYEQSLLVSVSSEPPLQNRTMIDGTVAADVLRGSINAEALLGSDGDDILNGREGDDFIFGEAGNDRLRNVSGDAVIFGGNGDDILLGGADDDRIHGENDDDYIAGRSGHDLLIGENGNDFIRGDGGKDVILGGAQPDDLYGNDGGDYLSGGNGADDIFGGGGQDEIHGDFGNDLLDGGHGHDVIIDGPGRDQIFGGSGNDQITNSQGDDMVYSGGGSDRIDSYGFQTDASEDETDHLWGENGPDEFIFRLELDAGSAHQLTYVIHDFNLNRDDLVLLEYSGGERIGRIDSASLEKSATVHGGEASTLLSVFTDDQNVQSDDAAFQIVFVGIDESAFDLI